MIPVSEIFGPTVQGEGAVLGRPTVFVRTGGCDFRCSWCDSLHAVLPEHRKEWVSMKPEEVYAEIRSKVQGPTMVTLSGGNPCMHSDLAQLIEMGHQSGDTFCVETQGTIAAHWLSQCDWVVLSPKPPSSGMKYDRAKLAKCVQAAMPSRVWRTDRINLKIPIFNSDDFYFAEHVGKQFPELPLYLSVGNTHPPTDEAAGDEFKVWERDAATSWQPGPQVWRGVELLTRYEWICNMVLQRGTKAIVTPQMHVLVWGNRRGV